MKYFKHDADARFNTKIRQLKRKYGAEGYGVYFQIVEIMAREVEKNNFDEWGYLPLEFQNDGQFLAEEIGVSADDLAEIQAFCVEIGLFQMRQNRLFCEQIIERSDEYTQKIMRQRRDKDETSSEHTPDTVGTKSLIRREEEQNRTEKKETVAPIEQSIDYLRQLPQSAIDEFTTRFDVSEKKLRSKADDLLNYCKAKGKKYRNYHALLLNAVKRDFKERSATVTFTPPPVLHPVSPEETRKLLEKARRTIGGNHV